jgi:hypothetical protein
MIIFYFRNLWLFICHKKIYIKKKLALGCHLKKLFLLGKVLMHGLSKDTKFLCGVSRFVLDIFPLQLDEMRERTNKGSWMYVMMANDDDVCAINQMQRLANGICIRIYNRFRSCHGIYSTQRCMQYGPHPKPQKDRNA